MANRNSGPLIGGRGPQSPVKFVLQNKLFADGNSSVIAQASYEWGTHSAAVYGAESIKSRIFASAASAVVVASALGAFINAPQQAYADVQPAIRGAVFAGATPQPIPRVTAPQQAFDHTPQAVYSHPPAQSQGQVPPRIFSAPQTDLIQQAAEVWSGSFAALVVANPAVPSYSVPPQYENRQYSQVWSSVVAGSTTAIIPSVWTPAQQYDATIQGQIRGTAPMGQGQVPPRIIVPPQIDPTQIAAQVWEAVPTPPAIAGVTVWPNTPVPPQIDYNVNSTVVWTPATFSPGNPLPVVDVSQSTPGRITRIPRFHSDIESEEAKRERRIQEGTIVVPAQPKEQEKQRIHADSRRVLDQIAAAKAESVALQQAINALETELRAERVKIAKAVRAQMEKDLLIAQQRLILIATQEAVLREELEVLDIAFIALVVLES